MIVYLCDCHPHRVAPSVMFMGDKWRVDWRDFHTVGQQAHFDTEREARDFAFVLHAKSGVIDEEELGGCIWEALAIWESCGHSYCIVK